MITEAQALAALPPKGFVRDYVQYANLRTDGSLAYQIGGALATLAQTAPTEMAITYGGSLYANIYTLAVGMSTESRKSAAVSLSRDLLTEANVGVVAEAPGSYEGFLEALRVNPRQLIVYSEFGDFLAKTGQGYMHPLKTAFTDAYDCAPLGRALAKSQRGAIQKPRVSIIGGVTLDFLEAYTAPVDWTGGFLARFLTFYATRERTYDFPEVTAQSLIMRRDLAQKLLTLVDLDTAYGPCEGLAKDARQLWGDWFAANERKLKEGVVRETRGAIARAPGMALKIALLLGWDYGAARSGEPWRITLAELEPALRIIALHIESVLEIGDRLAPNKDLKDRAAVLHAINGVPKPLGEVIRDSKVGLKMRVKQILETLEEEKAVRRLAKTQGGPSFYVLASSVQDGPDGEVIPLFGAALDGGVDLSSDTPVTYAAAADDEGGMEL